MAGRDFAESNTIDPLTRYRAIFGVPSRKRVFFGAACIFFVLTLIVISFAIMGNKESYKKLPYALFQNSLDVSIDPCVDFYNFTCGLWTQNNLINEDEPRVTTFSLLQNNISKIKKSIFENAKPSKDFPRVVNGAIRFYDTCVHQNFTNTNDIGLLLQYFDEIGGWPILNGSNWNESLFNLLEYSAFLVRKLDIHNIIGVYAIDNDKNDGRNVIYLKANEDITFNDVAFQEMVYAVLMSLNNSIVNVDVPNEIDILKLTADKWRELFTTPFRVSEPTFMSIKDLSTLLPDFPWLKYLQMITNHTLLNINETLTVHDVVAIDNLDHLKKVVNIINSDTFTKKELANLFGLFLVKKMWLFTPGVLQTYANWFSYDAEDTKFVVTNECNRLVLDLFPCSLDYMYVKNLSHAGIQDNKILTNFLKQAFQDIIQRAHWLDDFSKNSVLHRIGNLTNIIGFPDYLNNKTEFDEMYKNFPKIEKFSLSCYFEVLQYYIKMRFLTYKIATIQAKFILPRSVSHVSAYYMVHRNSLAYPISLHNPPFYYFEGPWYLNFGAIGAVIGHEMMHAVDCTGFQGSDLNVSWFSEDARKSYKKHASCFKDQYSVYDSSGTFKNNGTITLRENIADTEGLRLAYEAYKKHEKFAGPDKKHTTLDNYTPDQMFFIAFGTVWCSRVKSYYKEQISQSHSLNDIRVNKAVSNSESFASAFNCPEKSTMNPQVKCSIW